jgi:hypothetical protein
MENLNDLAAANQRNSSSDHVRDALKKISESHSEAVGALDLVSDGTKHSKRELTSSCLVQAMNNFNRVKQVKMSTVDIIDERSNVISVGKLELVKLIKETILLFENKMTDAVLDLVLEWNRSKDKSTISSEEAQETRGGHLWIRRCG